MRCLFMIQSDLFNQFILAPDFLRDLKRLTNEIVENPKKTKQLILQTGDSEEIKVINTMIIKIINIYFPTGS